MTKEASSSFSERTAARVAAVQALFQIEQTGLDPSAVILEFLNHRLKDQKTKINTSFFSKLVLGAWREHEKNDDILKGALKKEWSLDRLESVTRAIFRAALYEIIETKIPPAVTINEYLNITRSFSDGAEVAFVHGTLDTIVSKVRGPKTST